MLSYLLSDGILQQMHDKKIKDPFLKQNKGCSAIIVKDIYLFLSQINHWNKFPFLAFYRCVNACELLTNLIKPEA